MRRTLVVIALSHSLTAPLAAQTADPEGLRQQVEAVLSAAPAGTRFGLLVVDDQGREVLAINPDQRFIPASNTKLYTTAAAMALLAPQEAGAAPGAEGFTRIAPGALIGLAPRKDGTSDVVLVGRGDAALSSAPDCQADCLSELAGQVAGKIRRVHDVIGDASWFPDQRWSPGMSWNNIGTDSGTAIAALSLDDNELPVRIAPGALGQPPVVEIAPYYTLRNEAVTIAPGGQTTLAFERAPNASELRIYGEIALDAVPYKDRLGIDDPAHYAAWQLRRHLQAAGVKVSGAVRSRYRPLALIDDPELRQGRAASVPLPRAGLIGGSGGMPLAQVVARVNKDSQNLYAELLLRRIGRIAGTGSLADGLLAARQLFEGAGLPSGGFDLADGSGMSSYNRVSPRATVALLRWGAGQPWGGQWRASLPVGGIDGTLRRRFAGTPLHGRLFAKTGTLNATNALSGYLIAASGRELTFAAFANDVPGDKGAGGAIDAALGVVAAAN